MFITNELRQRGPSATTKRLLPPGIRVWLLSEPATDRIDDFGRLLRYVVRAQDGVNVNVRLVALGAAAPYFYPGAQRTVREPTGGAREAGEGDAPRPVG